MSEPSILPYEADALQIMQMCSINYGIIMCIDDPETRGRVLVECVSLFGEKPEFWTGWAQYGIPVGTKDLKGDVGDWLPPIPGQLVYLAFEGGNFQRPICWPAGAWGDDGKPLLPRDAASQKGKAGLLFP